MCAINSVQDFVDELADSGDNLVLVDFYAKWCHACRSLFPKLCQICRDNPDIKLLKIDWDENKDIAKTLGVRVLPFFQLYRGAEGRVAEFSCSVSKIQRLRDAIEAHHAARCSLGLNPTLKEYFPQNKPSHDMDRHEITILDSTGDTVLSQSLASFDGDEFQTQERERQPVA